MTTGQLRTILVAAWGALAFGTAPAPAQAPQFEVTFPAAVHDGPLTGRLVLMISKQERPEPRLALSPRGAAIYGLDIEQLAPGRPAILTEAALGYPVQLSELPAGDYFVQAVINVYERVSRADGHTIWVPMNDGQIEFFNNAAGNLYSDVRRIRIGDGGTVRLTLSKVIPPNPPPEDTPWIKRVRIQSQKLTKFWGRPVYVNATVLLPAGYDENPDVRYPSMYALGHGSAPFGFNPDPPRADATPRPTITRRGQQINPVSGVESGHEFYKAWISDGFPRMIAITLAQQTPYFPDSYSVNSANNGPYGDAIVEEVIPYLEEHFRIIRQPHARQLEGASTSGWQSLALQIQHPDFFGGAWILQPDPIDFRHYLLTNIYEDENAFTIPTGPFTSTERIFQRTVEGQPLLTTRQLSRFEAVLGSRGRSGYQLGAWEAVYGPVGPDGYPVPLWDKLTGKIDRDVANYMRDNGYDLRALAERNWSTLGPKLAGKLHFFSGDMDDYYLNLAVYRFEDFLKQTSDPHYSGDFTYGRPTKGHSWHSYTWAEMVRMVADSVAAGAPAGADVTSWRY